MIIKDFSPVVFFHLSQSIIGIIVAGGWLISSRQSSGVGGASTKGVTIIVILR